jgi:alpha-amylase
VHQPFRVKHYTVFQAGVDHDYFVSPHYDSDEHNEKILRKVAEKSYIPTNNVLLELLHKHPEFKISLSITGTVLEQMQQWAPHVLASFQDLVRTGRVEIVGETYYHSLAFFYSQAEFVAQVAAHADKVQELFGVSPTAFRNTELAYNNDLAYWADRAGYKVILSEGWDPVLGWRSPNFVYRPTGTENIKLLTKNYKLSDDVAFRFGDKNWAEWPLNVEKFTHWIDGSGDANVVNLFMDYETFGEHQWESTGIFEFLRALPAQWLSQGDRDFATVTEAATRYEAKDEIDTPTTITWADTERDLSAWLGNPMQQQAITALYALQSSVYESADIGLISDWRKLQTSDHFYYICTKWFSDGDIHAYFSPYKTPYEAYMNFMNVLRDIEYRLAEKGLRVP